MLDLERGNVLVLVGCDGHKLGGGKGVGPHLLLVPVGARYTHHVNSRLVLVQAVQHDLTGTLGFVGQLHLGEVDLVRLPVGSEVRRI